MVTTHLSTVLIDFVGELVEMLGATRDQGNPVSQLAEQTSGILIRSPCLGLVDKVLTLKKPLCLCGSQLVSKAVQTLQEANLSHFRYQQRRTRDEEQTFSVLNVDVNQANVFISSQVTASFLSKPEHESQIH